ncbi:formylglycine-generating enzyme family protein [Xanthovirga aplysinae]|uniref:formylglycine-generating enzyme family protein n=1 Tax=Xanthovirga aplysinae TaxID=2529853 RepID=UPI0012BBB7AC|nr:formylglycine-generating enzyme family protein [Xanthovirga aplysinae]MTI29507.1 formylglycine-generating enzyme family protein [Xanthovirga aplysinae]
MTRKFLFVVILCGFFLSNWGMSQELDTGTIREIKAKQSGFANIIVTTKIACEVFVNGQSFGVLRGKKVIHVAANKGDNLLQAESLEEGHLFEKIVSLSEEDKNSNKLVIIDFEEAIVEETSSKNVIDGMILVKGGTFIMGNKNGNSNEIPEHQVTVSDFYIGQYEVTVGEYRKFCEETGYDMPKEPSWEWNDNDPMVKITWHDAVAYCEWAGGRLPTEAEWEYAARGGVQSQGHLYSGENIFEKVAWHNGNSKKKVHPVGDKAPNELGIYDMSGNVWEWCSDFFSTSFYKKEGLKDPKGPKRGKFKVLRGGSWNNPPDRGRVSFRYSFGAKGWGKHIGFRMVKDVK